MNERDKEVVEFCKEAIRIPSPSGGEKGVVLLMKKKMEELGYDSVVIDEFGSCIGIINGSEPGKQFSLTVTSTMWMSSTKRNGNTTPGVPRKLTEKSTAAEHPT